MALDGLSATEWASYEPCVALVCLWQGGPCVHSSGRSWSQLRAPELGEGRRMGRDRAGNEIPVLSTPELGPKHPLAHPKISQHGLWVLQTQPQRPREEQGPCPGGLQPPWSPTPEPINCLGPWDEFVQSHFREEGDEIKSCNYLLKLQPLSRRTELLQTPLAGSPWMGERE